MQFQTLMSTAVTNHRESHEAAAQPRRRRVTYVLAVLAPLLFLGAVTSGVVYYWPERIDLRSPALLQKVQLSDGLCMVYLDGRSLVGELADFNDGFFAYLMFDYYRSRRTFAHKQVMLTSEERGQTTLYRISVRLPDDFIRGIEELAQFGVDHLTANPEYAWLTQDELARERKE